MQILILSSCLAESVKQHSDLHLKSCINSSRKLLQDVQAFHQTPPGKLHTKDITNPVFVWANSCDTAYSWLYDYHITLLAEHIFRFGRHHDYGSPTLTHKLFFPPKSLPFGALADHPPPKDVPHRLQHLPLIEAYRAYVNSYFIKASHRMRPARATWTARPTPDWILLDLITPNSEIPCKT